MMHSPLTPFPIVHTSDVSRLRDAVDKMTNYEHGVSRSSLHPPLVRGIVNGLRLDDISLVYVAYSTPVSVLAPPTGGLVVVVIPLGPMGVEVAKNKWQMTKSFILPSPVSTIMTPDPNAGALVGAVAKDTILGLLATAFGDQMLFDIDLSQPHPITLHAELALRRSWLAQTDGEGRPDAIDLLDALTVGLVNTTQYVRYGDHHKQHLPSYVVSAVQYLKKHYSERINLADVSRRVGISDRQLQCAFRLHVGSTANDYLRKIRLEKAYNLLTSSKPPRVADVAVSVGIPHLGRFAEYFTLRFGVRPSDLAK